MVLKRGSTLASVILVSLLTSPNSFCQTTLQKIKLGSYVEDLTFISGGRLAGQVAAIEGYDVFGLRLANPSAQAQKLFDLRALPSRHFTGIAYVESRDLFAINDAIDFSNLYFVDNRGQLLNTIHIQYPAGYEPDHIEALTYIPIGAPTYPDHLGMMVRDRSATGQLVWRLLIIDLSGQVVAQISPNLTGFSGIAVEFQLPDRLLITGTVTGLTNIPFCIAAFDLSGNVIAGPVPIADPGSFFEAVTWSSDGGIGYVGGDGGKLLAFDWELNRLPAADRTFRQTLGLSNPTGVTWNSDSNEHLISTYLVNSPRAHFSAIPWNRQGIASFAQLEQTLGARNAADVAYLPDLHLVAMAGSRSCPSCSIELFTSDGVFDRSISLSSVNLGRPQSLSYISSTQQFIVSFGSAKILYIISMEGQLVRSIDLTDTPITYLGRVAFFNSSHPTGGQLLIFESPYGGPGGTHRAIVTDLEGTVMREFDYLNALGVWWPADAAAITTGPLAGTFSVLDSRTYELTVFGLRSLLGPGNWRVRH